MDFPLRVLKFRLVNYTEDDKSGIYVRYLLKMNEQLVYASVQKLGNGYTHSVQIFTMCKKDGFTRYYPTEEQAFEALLSWMIGFNINQ